MFGRFNESDESGKTLRTSLYTKPTDTHQYLHVKSCQRAVRKKSILYSEAVRIKRRCSEKEDLQHKLGDLESWLVNRSYRADSARGEIQRLGSIDRQILLQKCPKIQKDSVMLVLTFHPALYIIFKILKSSHRIIEKLQTLKATLPKSPRAAFRNPKHSSKLRKDCEEQRGVFICGRKNCGICNILEPVNKFKSTTTGKVRKLIFIFIVTVNV